MNESNNVSSNDEANEKYAQLLHENKRLRAEIDDLRKYYTSAEETICSLSGNLTKAEKSLKSYEDEVKIHKDILEQNDQLIETLETNNENLTDINVKLKEDVDKFKVELQYAEMEISCLQDEIESLKTRETKLEIELKKVTEDKNLLVKQFEEKCVDCNLQAIKLKTLGDQMKELEGERNLLNEKLKMLHSEDWKSYSNSSKYYYSILGGDCEKGFDLSVTPKGRKLDFDESDKETESSSPKRRFSLQEELEQCEVRQKNQIQELEIDLETKSQALLESEKIINEKEDLISRLNAKISHLQNLDSLLASGRISPEGQSGENKTQSGYTPLTVVIKDGVQTSQPGIRVVETTSVVVQTDPVEIRTPGSSKKLLEGNNPADSISISDSDDDLTSLSPTDDPHTRNNLRLFQEPKNSDLDMDIFRSCRKLSVLPEEENDEALNRIPSFKTNINPKSFSAKLSPTFKTQSADDVTNIRRKSNPSSDKQVSSCVNIVLSSHNHSNLSPLGSPILDKDSPVCDKNSADDKPTDNANELQLPILDPADALRQPHSFDSYLDPQQIINSSLARQISDPTQNTVFAPPITRRGSYIKRPRSTCRPLRLPCDENGKKKEERVYKVRFDLSNNVNSKQADNTNGNKGPILASSLKNNEKNAKIISRFRVEIVDEEEFRKSIEESNKSTRKRPPLIHSVVYKKSVLHEIRPFDVDRDEVTTIDTSKMKTQIESPDSPSYDTATESSPVDSFETNSYESNYLIADIYPCKRRKQSDSSCLSVESQDSSLDGNDILIKSIKLHTNSECIVMKDLGKESPSRLSLEMDIPFIDADDLPVIKPSPEISKTTQTDISCFETLPNSNSNLDLSSAERKLSNDSFISSSRTTSPISPSDSSSGTFLTPCGDITPASEISEISTLIPPKSSGLSKSPTVLKNLANFELLNETVSHSSLKASHCVQSEIVEEENEDIEETDVEEDEDEDKESKTVILQKKTVLKRNSSDISETSDTVTYVTGKSDGSNFLLSSDCDSDTYVTIRSDRSSFLERKFSDLSENSSSPYNTPPDTSSASFCTPPDTYSPVLNRLSKYLNTSSENESPKSLTRSSSPFRNSLNGKGEYSSLNTQSSYDTPPNMSPFSSPPSSSPYRQKLNCYSPPSRNSLSETESITIYNIEDSNFPTENCENSVRKELIMFDSPKLEFYETNDSVENLEAFLRKEEGIREPTWKDDSNENSPMSEEPKLLERQKPCSFESFNDSKSFDESFPKRNSLDSPSGVGEFKFFRSKRHPPLSRQNSTEEYNFLEPHDSCLNLSEEISSPSTTPDTSNKTVIFKNKPLTVSNTIDLDDDDFPISESEIHINFNGSQTEILEIPVGGVGIDNPEYINRTNDIYCCRSEPCIPSISSSADLPEFSRLTKQSSSITNDTYDLPYGKSDTNLPNPPEIIVSNLSSESEQSDSEQHGGILIDFPSNISDRSEIHLSDVNSLSGQSDNVGSNSDQSENVAVSDRSSEIHDSDRSHSISPDVSDNSPGDKGSSGESVPKPCNHPEIQQTNVIHDTFRKTVPCSLSSSSPDNFIDIPSNLTSTDLGNLTVIDLPSCSAGIDFENTQEASFF